MPYSGMKGCFVWAKAWFWPQASVWSTRLWQCARLVYVTLGQLIAYICHVVTLQCYANISWCAGAHIALDGDMLSQFLYLPAKLQSQLLSSMHMFMVLHSSRRPGQFAPTAPVSLPNIIQILESTPPLCCTAALTLTYLVNVYIVFLYFWDWMLLLLTCCAFANFAWDFKHLRWWKG